jgi:hypothetical protein
MTLGLALDRTVYSVAILANDAAVCSRMRCVCVNEIV